jgi:hypothetical protein
MTDPTAPSLSDLIEQITTWEVGVPVRAMERVLAMREAAAPGLAECLADSHDDESRDLLWPIVLLGEFRHPGGIGPLIDQMHRTDLDTLALAAAEALAKIGPPAVERLLEVAAAPQPLLRLYAYASLGWIQDDRAYVALVEALNRDHELGDVVAMALGDQGRPEAIPLLYRAYQTCEPWQRIEFEDVMQELHWGQRPAPRWSQDWRLRYRRVPFWGSFEPGWTGVSALVRRHVERMAERVVIPLRSLEEIVRDRPEVEEPRETCETCGATVEYPTGLAVCGETAVSAAVYQLRFLGDARDDGLEDLFDLLDELEERQWTRHEEGEPVTPTARDRWRDEGDELLLCHQTCKWLIEQGVEEVGPARALLLAEAKRLADRYGDPEELLRPGGPPQDRVPKVGRNDPCPCGSGRKYKRCCLGRDREPSEGA